MTAEQQLSYESRVRLRQAVIAVVAGALLMIATIIGLAGPHAKVDELTLGLITDHRRGALDIISAAISGLAQIAVAWTLVFVFRCAKARAPQARSFIAWLAVIGAVLAVVAGILNAVIIAEKVHEFVTTGAQTYDEADRLTSGAGLLILQVASQLASLIVAISFVLVSLQAMRVGLLPRFLGYVGMFAGALVLFPIIVVPVVQLYWLVAVGALIIGRWPSGQPLAWTSGQAEAWPSANEMRARRAAEAGEVAAAPNGRRQRRGGGRTLTATTDSPAVEAPAELAGSPDAQAGGPTPARRKRKRKR